jgi:aspartate 1-decarboxylase
MLRHMLLGKIHRATVTGAELHYEGSVTVDEDLLELSGILPYERVDIWNVTNGERFSTYALAGQRGSGVVCINGAAAHKASRGDLVIVAAFAEMEEEQARAWVPRAVFVDEHNRPVEKRLEKGGQADLFSAWG